MFIECQVPDNDFKYIAQELWEQGKYNHCKTFNVTTNVSRWSGWYTRVDNSLWGHAYCFTTKTSYNFYSSNRGADTVLKKLGSPEIRQKTYSGKPGSNNPTITFDVEGPVLFAGIVSADYTVYSWDENYNHYASSSASCTWSGNTISVRLSGGNSVVGNYNVSLTVQYICE